MANTDFVRLPIDMRSLGSTGLRQYGGFVRDEILPELTGIQGARVYREMVDNDAVIGGIMFIIDTLVRMVPWRVQEASSAPFDLEAAEFLESNMDDMDQRWGETICEMMSMVPYGYSLHEILYKRRCGDSRVKAYRSKYRDGRVGWRGMPIRSQDTIRRWMFDKSGDIVGAEQLAPPFNRATVLPLSRCLHLRTRNHKNNPEGRSALRSCYRGWYKKQVLENIEGVGAERDLAGLPVAWVPPDIIAAGKMGGDAAAAQLYQEICTIVDNIRADEQASLVMPLAYDENGNKMFDLTLMSSAGAKQFDCDKIIQRYDNRNAVSLCADFVLMGQSSSTTGSFAMHTDKSKLFARAVGTFLDIICDQLNDVAVPELFRVNDFKTSDYPQFAHGKIEQQDLKELGDFLVSMSSAGMPLFPNPDLEEHICDVAGIPRPMDISLPDARTPKVEPSRGSHDDTPPQEIHDDASLEEEHPEGLDTQTRSTGTTPRLENALSSRPTPKPGAPVSATDRLANAALSSADRPIRKAANYDESKHPRADNGEFGTGSTSSGKGIAGTDSKKYTGANNAKTPKDKAKAVASSHPDFTPKDHVQAAQAHQKAAAKSTGDKKERHEALAQAHADNAKKAPAPAAPKGEAEPKRGDKVRAKEVKDAHPNFTPKDHLNAAQYHNAMAKETTGADRDKHNALADAHLANAKKSK